MRLLAVAGALAVAASLAGCDPASQFGPLHEQWKSAQSGQFAATPVPSGQDVYIGDWWGYEYDYDQATGALHWKTSLGTTYNPICQSGAGITSHAAILNGTAYLGGGDDYWYALDAATGGVQWKLFTGDSSQGAYYNWASPAIYNGYLYIGLASYCDEPLVQGQLWRVNLATHQVENVWKAVPDGQVGGTIWTTPVVDPSRNTVFVTTGTRPDSTQAYAEAMVALDATTLAVKGYWHIPTTSTGDLDWGTTPTLFTDANGRQLVGSVDKNGIFYAFLRDNVSAGPVWQVRIADQTTEDPTSGSGSTSNAYFDGKLIYQAGGQTTIGGTTYGGSVRALDPTTGNVVLARGLPKPVLAALTAANGMIVAPAMDALYVLDASNGNVVYANKVGDGFYAAGAVANSRLFVGDLSGYFHAYGYPASVGAPSAPAASAAAARVARAVRISRAAGGCRMATRGSLRCRVKASPRCGAAALPHRSAGTVRVDRIRLVVRASRARPVRVAIHANAVCAGTPALRATLRRPSLTLRLRRTLYVPRGAVLSVRASRRATLRVAVTGRWRRG